MKNLWKIFSIKKSGELVSLLILPLIAVVIYSALMGYIYRAPPIWGFETTIFLYGCLFMLGSAYAHMQKKHVAVDALVNNVGPKVARVLYIFAEIIVLFVALVMLYMSIPAAYRSTLIRERSHHLTPWGPQIWWFRWVIPITCALISWQAFKDLLGLITGKGFTKDREGENNAA